MKVFVFGAGASKDSQQIENLSEGFKAPLMRELFLDRYYPFAKEVGLPFTKFVNIRNEAGNNVEAYLTSRWEEIKSHQSQRYQEAERILFAQLVFYIWRLLITVSNTYNTDERNSYRLFVDKILSKDEDYGFINFNYDTFLDKAIKDGCHTDCCVAMRRREKAPSLGAFAFLLATSNPSRFSSCSPQRGTASTCVAGKRVS